MNTAEQMNPEKQGIADVTQVSRTAGQREVPFTERGNTGNGTHEGLVPVTHPRQTTGGQVHPGSENSRQPQRLSQLQLATGASRGHGHCQGALCAAPPQPPLKRPRLTN